MVLKTIFDLAKSHISAPIYKARPRPLETILLPTCLEHGKMLGEILRKLKQKHA